MSLLEEILFLAGMAICGLIPFVLLTWLMQKGKNGLALTILSVLGAGFTVMIYATNHDFGIDPVRAIGIALIFFQAFTRNVGHRPDLYSSHRSPQKANQLAPPLPPKPN